MIDDLILEAIDRLKEEVDPNHQCETEDMETGGHLLQAVYCLCRPLQSLTLLKEINIRKN
ncbi:MAG TPA: hypothetical protein PLU81_16025 [Deltaproteobacteria bacterium]|nr:hypothetical protein [Deltaproteobacteria bacterium]